MGSFHIGAMAESAGWSDYPATFKTAPNYTPRRGLKREKKLESMHRNQSTHNLHHRHVNLSSSSSLHGNLSGSRQREESVRNRTLSNPGEKLSDGAWCMERFLDRPFKILWRMKHTV